MYVKVFDEKRIYIYIHTHVLERAHVVRSRKTLSQVLNIYAVRQYLPSLNPMDFPLCRRYIHREEKIRALCIIYTTDFMNDLIHAFRARKNLFLYFFNIFPPS